MSYHSVESLGPAGSVLSEAVAINDILDEMNGLTAQFLSDHATTRGNGTAVAFTSGSTHRIEDWNGNNTLAVIDGASVPKTLLEPVHAAAVGVRRYDVGLAGQRRAVARNQAQLSGRLAAAERRRLTNLLARRHRIYSQMWLRQMMYNRFDADILRWTTHYNRALSPSVDLDPNIPKSIFFQESRMGTSGRFLLMPPYSWTGAGNHPIMSRFNIGQAIDSFGPQQWLMMQEMASAIFARRGLDALIARRRWFGMTNEQFVRYPGYTDALREFFEARSDGANMMGAAARDLHLDYAFWIRTAIRWLFIKKSGRTWAEAARAYNGSGARAEAYRDAVMARVGSTSPHQATDAIVPEQPVESGSNGARLSWDSMTRIRSSRGVSQLYYVNTGAPPSVARVGDESHAVFNLKVENTNDHYNHQNARTLVRLYRLGRGRVPQLIYPPSGTSPSWNVASQPDLEDESDRIIPIRFPKRILEQVYSPEWPYARLEVEYRWQEVDQFQGGYYSAQTGIDFALMAPVELMFRNRRNLRRVDFSQLPARDVEAFKRKFWVPVQSTEFNRYVAGNTQITLSVTNRVARGSSVSATQSNRQGSSQTTGSQTTTGFSITGNVGGSRESSIGANIEIFELGLKNMMEFGIGMGYSRSVTQSSSSTVSRELTRSIIASRTFQRESSFNKQYQFSYGPSSLPSTSPRRGSLNLGVYLAPIVDYYEVPYVRYTGVNRFGQATRRAEGRTLVPIIRSWRTLVRRD